MQFKQVISIFAIILVLTAASMGSAAPVHKQQVEKLQNPVKVRLGIDNLDRHLTVFQGKRVGLITNQTGMTSEFQSTIDVLKAKTQLVALFSPEHGIRGHVPAGASVGSYTDESTGVPVYSLYGQSKRPTAEMLTNIDVLAFDMQDIGARFYTYMYTMAYAMQSAKEHGKTFVVFDRPNPVGGEVVEGNIIQLGYESFIGLYPIPARHGLTIGELARLMNSEYNINCDLIVIPMTGWQRSMHFGDTGLPWVMTSPNIPTPDTALAYSGTGIFGGTNVSEGIGTTRPFELVGAPWINAAELAGRMNAAGLPGVVFRPVYFTPRQPEVKHQGRLCGGVQIHVTDKQAFRPVRTGLSLLYVISEMDGGKFSFNQSATAAASTIDIYTGDSNVRWGAPLDVILTQWDEASAQFKEMSKKYYLY
ncbi:exo-beta-N-acetylmuramidase NamZ family protein [Sporomusa malonica]|uniref:Uncharacterized conserved protein YbbC, DUF1343 family n=1 Tax=Sporomusa malonica TaxID=112901 RepID=A0A1W2EYH6_9FIRM|nr:DUF1343 domain-containing protein [Sporomusa malonica]SMD14755.1 Uncharacterized conserved protein YbbC, DUF1343 family [Sporomusa malonica]